MNKRLWVLVAVVATLAFGLGYAACQFEVFKSDKGGFDAIRSQVLGKSEREVISLLGKPDSDQPMLYSAKRLVWWNYTSLEGPNYAPEERGTPVHLEIIFEKDPGGEFWVRDDLQVSYVLVKPPR